VRQHFVDQLATAREPEKRAEIERELNAQPAYLNATAQYELAGISEVVSNIPSYRKYQLWEINRELKKNEQLAKEMEAKSKAAQHHLNMINFAGAIGCATLGALNAGRMAEQDPVKVYEAAFAQAKNTNARRLGFMGFGGPRMGNANLLKRDEGIALLRAQQQAAIERGWFDAMAPAMLFLAKGYNVDPCVIEAGEQMLSRVDGIMREHVRVRLAMATNNYIYAQKMASAAGMDRNASTAFARGALGAVLQIATGAVSGAAAGPWGALLGGVCAGISSATKLGVDYEKDMLAINVARNGAFAALRSDKGSALAISGAAVEAANVRLVEAQRKWQGAQGVANAATGLAAAGLPALHALQKRKLEILEKQKADLEAAAKLEKNKANLELDQIAQAAKKAATEKLAKNQANAKARNNAAAAARRAESTTYGEDAVKLLDLNNTLGEIVTKMTPKDKEDLVALQRTSVSAEQKIQDLGKFLAGIAERDRALQSAAATGNQSFPPSAPLALGFGGGGGGAGAAAPAPPRGGAYHSTVSVPPVFEIILIACGLDRTVAGLAMGMINGPDNFKRGMEQFISSFPEVFPAAMRRRTVATLPRVYRMIKQNKFLQEAEGVRGGSSHRNTRKNNKKIKNNKSRRV
jgi:hypothetical protein